MIRGQPNDPVRMACAVARWEEFERKARRMDRLYGLLACAILAGLGVYFFRLITGG